MATITLTQEQWEQLKNDMDSQIEMLNDEEILYFASKLNDEINIPFVREEKEEKIFVKIVKKIDRFLYQNLPNELYGLVKITSDGISKKEAEQLKLVLGSRLNKKFDIPYVPEFLEQEIFELAVSIIVKAMKKNFNLLKT